MGFDNLLKDKAKQQLLLLAFLWASILFAAYWLSEVLLPFMLAALLAYVLDPLVSRLSGIHLQRFTLPRWAAVLSVYALVGVFAYVLATIFFPELYREVVRLTKTTSEALNNFNESQIQDYALKVDALLHRYNIPVEIVATPSQGQPTDALHFGPDQNAHLLSVNLQEVIRGGLDEIAAYIRAKSTDIVNELQLIVRGVFNFIFKLVLVLMIAGFILVDTGRIKRFMLQLVPAQDQSTFDRFLARLDQGLSGVVRGQLLICLINAVLTLIGLLLLKIKFALILATLAGVFSLVPIFGSIISTIPIAIVALMTSPLTALLAVGWIVAIHALEANFLNPNIMGNAAKIHPVLVVLALIAGEHFYGIVGALLAVPITSVLLTIFQSLLNKAHSQG